MGFAKDSIYEKDLLVAQVLYDKTNVALVRKYGVTAAKLPVVKLLVKGEPEPIPFDERPEDFTIDRLRHFVSENSGLNLSSPGYIKELDKLAIQFMQGEKNERKKVLKKTEEHLKIMDKESSSGTIYKTIMENILQKGDDFIQSEVDRVKKLLSGKVSDQKKRELGTRINILQTFQSFRK
ncbi:hypothetical protein PYW07_008345 [Mythimna separata]|uniref:Uncharacterized protein n=1 Tax=Mythimna separata TaxID=271217 RepID=A0AAD7YDJ6_MYTSE|nr:hypothetical protein PYW07_008345 [Mythimna separata]